MIRRFLRRMKDVALLAALTSWAALGIRVYIEVGPAAESAQRVSWEARQSIGNFNRLIQRIDRDVDGIEKQADDREIQRSIGLLARSGDDLARMFKRTNGILFDLGISINQLGGLITQTEKATAGVTESATKLIGNADRELSESIYPQIEVALQQMKTTSEGITKLTGMATETAEAVTKLAESTQARVADPEIEKTIENLERASLASAETAERVESITRPIRWVGIGFKKIWEGITYPWRKL